MTDETPAPYDAEIAEYFDEIMSEERRMPTYEEARSMFWHIWCDLVDAPIALADEDRWIPREFVKWLIQDQTCELDLKKGIFFFGTHGCGKTTLMRAGQIFAHRCLGEPYGFRSIAKIKMEADSLKSIDAMNTYLRGDWCFDDIGQQDENVVIFSRYNIVETLICDRISTRWKTIATSNLLPSEISERYGPVVASRFNQLFNVVGFQTPEDHRRG